MSDRFSDYSVVSPWEPLVSLADTKSWFGVGDTSMDDKLTLSIEAVSDLIRGYLARYLTSADFLEVFRDVVGDSPLRSLREYPLAAVTSGATIYNASNGQVMAEAGELVSIAYTAGFTKIPSVIKMIFFELTRQQMFLLGVENLGTGPTVNDAPTKAVTIGTLKVEFGVPAGAAAAQAQSNLARGSGGLTEDALNPYKEALDVYRSRYAVGAI